MPKIVVFGTFQGSFDPLFCHTSLRIREKVGVTDGTETHSGGTETDSELRRSHHATWTKDWEESLRTNVINLKESNKHPESSRHLQFLAKNEARLLCFSPCFGTLGTLGTLGASLSEEPHQSGLVEVGHNFGRATSVTGDVEKKAGEQNWRCGFCPTS